MSDAIKIVGMIGLLCAGLLFLISEVKMRTYLVKRGLMPTWKAVTSWMLPFTTLKLYYEATKKEYGHVGIWYKVSNWSVVIFIVSIFLAIVDTIIFPFQR